MSHPPAATCCLLLAPSALSHLAHSQQAETAGHAADEAAIKAIVAERWMGGWNAHHAHQFSSMFTEDADFTNVRGQSASGQAEIDKFHAVAFERFFKQSHQTGEVTKIRFLQPDLAAVDIHWEMTGALDNTGNINAQDGRQRMPGVGGLSLGYFQVQRIDPARLDPDQHLAFGRRGALDRSEEKRRSVSGEDERSHLM